MRFLVDQPVSWRLALALHNVGHDAVHVRQLGMASARDDQIIDRAVAERRIIITQDGDFGTLLFVAGRTTPSVVYFRLRTGDPSA